MSKERALIGERVRFHYPDFGEPETYPELRAHSGLIVTVVDQLDDDDGETIYQVQADDGVKFAAFDSELGDEPDFEPHDPAFCGCDREQDPSAGPALSTEVFKRRLAQVEWEKGGE